MFTRCIEAPYIHAENSSDYYIERQGSELFVYFEPSNGCEDWKNNLDFPAVPYKNMENGIWFAHRGFLRVWNSIKDEISEILLDERVSAITEVGYSHGAALATLCHEFVYFNRPDLFHRHRGFAFGSPRVLWGIKTKAVKKRFQSLTVIRNIDDAVTHLPPTVLGYKHIGKMLEIGKKGRYTPIDAHRFENILNELEKLDI